MGLSWSSFIIEIINFLVLIWILKRLFYAPIHKAIQSRKMAIQETLNQANELHDEAMDLQTKYEHRLQDWGIEKSEKMKEFQQELANWKFGELKKFEKSLTDERNKMISREKQKTDELIDKNSKLAFDLAGKFATRFLSDFADETLNEKIVEKTLIALSGFKDPDKEKLKSNLQDQQIHIASAFTLSTDQKNRLTQAMQDLLMPSVSISFSQEADLMAGLRITLGSLVLKADLKDELNFFTETSHDFS